jgi:hypothetical protein
MEGLRAALAGNARKAAAFFPRGEEKRSTPWVDCCPSIQHFAESLGVSWGPRHGFFILGSGLFHIRHLRRSAVLYSGNKGIIFAICGTFAIT